MHHRLREYFRTENRIRHFLAAEPAPGAVASSAVALVRLPMCCAGSQASSGYQALYAMAFERAREAVRSAW
jgi:hypothetical protein